MALYMSFYVIPDDHIEYLQKNPEYLSSYVQGKKPDIKKSFVDKILGREVVLDLPEDWPSEEIVDYTPEINHRQVKIFHYILNGNNSMVDHAGCVFQTWFNPWHKCVALNIDGENFALSNADTSKFNSLIESVYPDLIYNRYIEITGEESVSEEDKEFLDYAFKELLKVCRSALKNGNGLMWVVS